MTRTTVNIDAEKVAQVAEIFGTSGVSDTVEAALADVLRRQRLATVSIRDFDITWEDVVETKRKERAIGRVVGA